MITERSDYDAKAVQGCDPLLGDDLDIFLRVSIQHERFGFGHTPAENERFYRWVWAHKAHRCEECMRPLPEFSATFVSHIISRGAGPEQAHDPRNTNILCFRCHSQWETGDRARMRIYTRNQNIISKLKREYNELRYIEGKHGSGPANPHI